MSPYSQMSPYRRAVWAFLLPTAALLIAISGFFVLLYIEGEHRENERRHARRVFCEELEKVKRVQRADLTRRINEAEAFLRDNPAGLAGIPADVIQRGIEGNRQTRQDLRPVDCEDFARIKNIDIEEES